MKNGKGKLLIKVLGVLYLPDGSKEDKDFVDDNEI